MNGLKRLLLYIGKWTGTFLLARWLTRDGLRILCYHGFTRIDEHSFRPKLFMTPATFRRRMALLRNTGYSVLALDEAVARLQHGDLPPAAVAITIDDGWYGVLTDAAPALAEHGMPATLYLTTYYAERQTPVFNVLVGYLFWASRAASVSLDGLGRGLSGTFDLTDPAQREAAADAVVEAGTAQCDAAGRDALSRILAVKLGHDFSLIDDTRACMLLTLDEAAALPALGIDLQLHTHRHRFPADDRETAEREIADNRRAMANIAASPLVHFCYPSGKYAPNQWPWLESLGIASATTTAAGLNFPGANRYALARQLDGEDVSEIEFEAELSGLTPLLRRWLGRAA